MLNQRTVRRTAGVAAVSALLLSLLACNRSQSITAIPDAADGELVTLFTAADVDEDIHRFGVSDAAPLPDGTVVVSYDLAAESAGDETPRQERLAILGEGGALAPLALPELDGVQVTPDASLLAAGPDGTIYLWDRGLQRVVARGPDGQWRVLPVELALQWRYAPLAAVGEDGVLYLCDDDAVQRLDADGTLTRVVGVYTPNAEAGQPPITRDQLPLPASSIRLPYPSGMAVGADGTVFVSNRDGVLTVDGADMLSLVKTWSDLQEQLGVQSTTDPPYLWSSLAIDADGSLLVSDGYQQLVADVFDPILLLRGAAFVTDGQNASLSPGSDLLVRVLDPDALLAGESEPDELAAYGS